MSVFEPGDPLEGGRTALYSMDLSSATVTDPNSILNGSPTLSADGWSVPIDAAGAATRPEDGVMFARLALDQTTGQSITNIAAADLLFAQTRIKSSSTAGGSNNRVFIGYSDSVDLTGNYMGVAFDQSQASPRGVTYQDSTGVNAGSNSVGCDQVASTMAILAGRGMVLHIQNGGTPDSKAVNLGGTGWLTGTVYLVASWFPAGAYTATAPAVHLEGAIAKARTL